VILGVMTVVAVAAVLSGLNGYVAESLSVLTPELFIVSKFGLITSREEFLEARRRKDLTLDDLEAVSRECRECAETGGQVVARKAVTFMDRRLADVQINGTTSNIERLFRFSLDEGRWFTQTEYEHAAPIAVIGYDVKDELFPRLDPIGRIVKVEGNPYKVIGLITRRGSIFGNSQDKEIDIPMTAYVRAFGGRRSVDIFVKAASADRVPIAEDEVRAILRARRHTPFRSKDPFGTLTGDAILTIWKRITIGLFAAMILISGISLVVGGIVIANIMLVSVTERTREIGLRMALGARKRQVLLQFLLEAALMAAAGGAIGLAAGSGIAALIAHATPLPTRVTPFLVAVSLGVATSVGLIAGIAPSIRASNLEPVEALRSE
jgi:putative ABC transport system permease protein